MSVVMRAVLPWLAVFCLALYVAPGVMASSVLDHGDEVESTSLWSFLSDFVAHSDSDEEDDVESDSSSHSDSSSDSDSSSHSDDGEGA